jgi:hypothetical protein
VRARQPLRSRSPEGARRTHAGRLIGAVVLTLLLATAWPAAAQQWKIYLVGKVEPIVADLYVEETPWILFHDDQSIYVFAVGCNRVERVERDGVALPPPACPIERLPTMTQLIYFRLVELEGARFDATFAKLTEQTRQLEAAQNVQTATGLAAQQGVSPEAVRATQERLAQTADLVQQQINVTLAEVQTSSRRIGLLIDAAKSFPPSEKRRFFFAPR